VLTVLRLDCDVAVGDESAEFSAICARFGQGVVIGGRNSEPNSVCIACPAASNSPGNGTLIASVAPGSAMSAVELRDLDHGGSAGWGGWSGGRAGVAGGPAASKGWSPSKGRENESAPVKIIRTKLAASGVRTNKNLRVSPATGILKHP